MEVIQREGGGPNTDDMRTNIYKLPPLNRSWELGWQCWGTLMSARLASSRFLRKLLSDALSLTLLIAFPDAWRTSNGNPCSLITAYRSVGFHPIQLISPLALARPHPELINPNYFTVESASCILSNAVKPIICLLSCQDRRIRSVAGIKNCPDGLADELDLWRPLSPVTPSRGWITQFNFYSSLFICMPIEVYQWPWLVFLYTRR